MRATATLVRRPQTSYAAPFGHEQGHAGSLHPEGQCSADVDRTRGLLLILAGEHAAYPGFRSRDTVQYAG